MRRLPWLVPVAVVALGLAIQAVPYGRRHINPPVLAEPPWDTPATRALTVRACFDCHSNETVWPWYSHVAPISWLVQIDVDEGRRAVNFSEWTRTQREARESAETVREGKMPPWIYAIRRPETRLSSAERNALASGLAATLGTGSSRGGRPPRSD